MIEIKTFIEIVIGIVVIVGGIVSTILKGQNMKIEQLRKEIDELKRKQSIATSNQIRTEKNMVAINVKLNHILEAIEDLKIRKE